MIGRSIQELQVMQLKSRGINSRVLSNAMVSFGYQLKTSELRFLTSKNQTLRVLIE